MAYPRPSMTRRRLLLALAAPAGAFALSAALGTGFWGTARGGPAFLRSIVVSEVLWAALAVSAAALATGSSIRDRLGLDRGRMVAGELAVAVLGFVALSSAFHQAIALFSMSHTGTLGHIDEVVKHTRLTAPWLAFLALAVAPAICEELLFRGFLQRIVRFRFGVVAGVLAGAAAFGLAHWDPAQSTAAFGLGLYLGTVAQVADSTRPTILCHLVNNGLGVGLGLLGASIPEGGGWITVATLAGASLAGLLWLSLRRSRRPTLGVTRRHVVGEQVPEGEGEPQEPTP